LQIFCLGPLRVFRDGAYITEAEWGQTKGPTQKVKALFAYLLARGRRGATKDALVELLWGDQPASDKGDARLHAALYYLRRALEPHLMRRSESRYIRYEDGLYRLEPPDGCWVDALAFEEYYQQAQRLEKEGQEEIAARFWKLAESLYHGDYMVDLSPCYTEDYIDDCCQGRRSRFRDMYLSILLKLTRYYLRCNQDQLSLKYAQQVLAGDRSSEDAHRLMMQLMHRTGQREDLIRQYRLCERDLAKAEDRCPSPETVQLYRQLLQTVQQL
jgi:two-component SAPR family response regulator